MTTRALRAVAIGGLAFLGSSAVLGACDLLMVPAGAPYSVPLNLLQYSPFHSYLVPGIVLLVANGLLSLLVLFFTVRHVRNYGRWIVIQGMILAIWLLAEVAWLRLLVWAQGFYFGVAALLVLTGWVLHRRDGSHSSS